jgi:flagella basal body P-ring formation protein FlgA
MKTAPLAASLATLATLLATAAAAAPTLRPVVRIAAGIVTVGDLVDGAGPLARTPLYRSPDLGTTGAVPTSDIVARLASLGLSGVATGGLAEVIVTRLATEVTGDDIARRLAVDIAGRLGAAPDRVEIAFDQTPPVARADSAARQPFRIVDLAFQPSSGRFDAAVEIDQGGPVTPMRLRGQATEMAEVIVLARPLQKGDVVAAGDVILQRVPRAQADRIGQTVPDTIVGKAARRPLRAGQPALAADFGPPIVVTKGDAVTVTVEAPGLVLAVRGLAQEAGAVGDQVAVLNEQSRRTIHGEVVGPAHVVVRRPVALPAAVARLERNTP